MYNCINIETGNFLYAIALAKKVDVIGYDYNAAKIDLYKSGIDPTPWLFKQIFERATSP